MWLADSKKKWCQVDQTILHSWIFWSSWSWNSNKNACFLHIKKGFWWLNHWLSSINERKGFEEISLWSSSSSFYCWWQKDCLNLFNFEIPWKEVARTFWRDSLSCSWWPWTFIRNWFPYGNLWRPWKQNWSYESSNASRIQEQRWAFSIIPC